jgi:hypothetical protein
MNIRWDHFVNQYDSSRYVTSADGRDNRHIQFVREFAGVVSILQVRIIYTWPSARRLTALQDKTNSVIDLYKDILRAVEDLATCSYTSEAFSELLGKVQAAVSALLLVFPRRIVDDNSTDRSTKSGRLRQPGPLGGRARQADRNHSPTTAGAHHSSMVCRVRQDRRGYPP